ncbi:hypothetical protein PR202_gb20058 [Eleusine coracana subsp. coracana]|uniref:tRNA pseudouridine synthase n=1 Tax=Eleusine coracana subsp. coracana TaxID=191504 RepID=A0AAV5F9U4_ELECO|nr:hypothetical protein PR202_gb20058 [Eleusine coracana subsp. coracana]
MSMYLYRFYGFSSEGQAEPTVESEIFKALERAKLLVGSRKESCYSRCGRTDKGVSATGQVGGKIPIMPASNWNARFLLTKYYPFYNIQVISLYLRSNIKDVGGDGLHEKSGWCPVPADFHARFTCLGREYKYLFWKGDLDIADMQKAASKFIGEHDFRNFCKMDAANIVDSLLDITRTPRKPQYKMAPEVPLILRSCVFDNANFMCSSGMSY